jgi:hypothetical protein
VHGQVDRGVAQPDAADGGGEDVAAAQPGVQPAFEHGEDHRDAEGVEAGGGAAGLLGLGRADQRLHLGGQRAGRIVGDAVYTKTWSPRFRTQIGGFLEIAEGNRFSSTSTNRYSFIYSGDVNGDGQGGNDLIYIPRDQSEINLAPYTITGGPTISAAEQWAQLDAFIRQDDYLSKHRGEIAERFGGENPWYSDVDLRILQDIGLYSGAKQHALQLSLDVLNVGNLLNSDWGVRKVASASATSPLRVVGSTPSGAPIFNFTGPTSTLIDDPGIASRWRIQLGLRYFFN